MKKAEAARALMASDGKQKGGQDDCDYTDVKPADRKNVRKPSLRKCLLVRIRHIAAVAGAECYGKACCAIANAGKSDEMYYFLLCAVGPCA